MPRLTDIKIRSSKPRAKPFKLYDTDGLFLIVNPNGSKWWRQRYRFAGREQLLSLGVYDAITLAEARDRSAEVRKLVAKGVDPSAHRKAKTAALIDAKANTLKTVTIAWHEKFKPQWSAHHAHRVLQRLEDNVFPWLGAKALRDVTSADILACVDRMAKRGAYDTARRVLQILKKVFKWAIGRGLIAASPAAHIEPREQLPSIDIRHRAAITDPTQLGALMRAIDSYQGGLVVKCALQLIALTFVRPGELRRAEWPEFQLDGKEPMWRIPAARMKMGGEDHIVPLSSQAIAVLREIQPLTGADGRGYVFPGTRNAARPLSENTLNVALRAMGFTQQQHCSHGFRGTASTLLNEQQWNKDAIELQLAHMPRDKVRASYNGAAHLPLRREMMQAWADYLDALKAGVSTVPPTKRPKP
ncbi:MAG TPA: integrase arm-type DNA-binding domain-containing protein [Steroidobacter sp.]|uniref:tyrosine-type recombinase/integrase n=1 Tax=Steroidobacter sp. TaxID=1978227 RepID=UPI002ED994ED